MMAWRLCASLLLVGVASGSSEDCAASESGTCIKDVVSAVQARQAVPQVQKTEGKEEIGTFLTKEDGLPDNVMVYKESHMTLPQELERSRIGLLARVQRGRITGHKKFDCEAHPHMCEAPFNCQDWTLKDTLNVMLSGFATKDGHANPRSWCLPGAEDFADNVVKHCLAGLDLPEGAAARLALSAELGHAELDASYCFAEGHCSNEAVHDNTTLEDSEAICDHRFGGREGWTSDFLQSLARTFNTKSALPSLVNGRHGFRSRLVTSAITKMSCATGVFHCDVQFCKQTYCKDDFYQNKYGFLKPGEKGHMLQDLAPPENNIPL